MRGAMLFAAGLFAGLAVQVAVAQNAGSGVVMMNHVGIIVPNIEEAVKTTQRRWAIAKRSGSTTRRGSRGWSTCRSARTLSSSSIRPTSSGRLASRTTAFTSRGGRGGREIQERWPEGERSQQE